MTITVIVDIMVSRYLHKASAEHGSSALEADAYHFTTDLWGAVAVIIGLAFVSLGFPVFDAIAAIAVAALMLWISYKLGKKSINILLDKSPPDAIMERISSVISTVAGVKSFHKLRARQAGNKIFVDVDIHVSPSISIRKGHDIAHEVRKRLEKEIPNIKHVSIHVEPHEDE
jgi:cation diffusion facilitator family transporter